ncbi:hypothetical protein V1502_20180 [Bacillus sp. SCS-153A]
MKKEKDPDCNELDYLNHFLIEQINRISVEDQEKQMKAELDNHETQ